jgi:hypothetical protein
MPHYLWQAPGTRYDGDVSEERIDDADNLVLLCRVHHKMVDDQYETYTVELLRNLKQNLYRVNQLRIIGRGEVMAPGPSREIQGDRSI